MKRILQSKKIFFLLFTLFFISIVLIPLSSTGAVSYLLKDITCIQTGNCTVNDLLKVFVNISNWILGILGSVALLMFVVGGVLWIFSGGNEQRVTQGKQIIVGTVVGIALVLGSWLIIKFLGEVLGSKYQLSEGPCANVADGQSAPGCDDNQVCYNNFCISKCEYRVKKGELEAGYACQFISFCATATIKTDLCPGGTEIRCCQSRETTPLEFRGGREISPSGCCVPGDFRRSCYAASPTGCLAGDTLYSQVCSEVSTCQDREMVGCCQSRGGGDCIMVSGTRCDKALFYLDRTCRLPTRQCE